MGVLLLSIVTVSLVTSLVGVLVSLIFNSLKGRLTTKLKYMLWIGMLVSLLLPFRPRFGGGLVQLSSKDILPKLVGQQGGGLSGTEPALADASQASWLVDLSWLQLLLGLWVAGVLISLGLHLYHWWKFQHLLKRWGKPVTDRQVLDSLVGAKELLAITQEVSVSRYPLTQTPMLIGFSKPHILLPEGEFTDDELDLIFEHELTHFKHRDAYVNVLIMLVTSLHWFNPFVKFMAKEAQEAAESYCDHAVLVYQDKSYRTFYGETLISMINRSRQPRTSFSSCFYSNKFNLKRRMEAILTTQTSTKGLGVLAVLLVGLSLVFSGSVFAWVEQTSLVTEQPELRAFPSLDADTVKTKVFAQLGINQKEVTDITVTSDTDSYYVHFKHDNYAWTYVLSKAKGELVLKERTPLKSAPSSSKVTSSSTAASSASSASTSAASSQAAQTETSSTAPDAQAETPPQPEAQAPAAEVSPAAPAPAPEPVVSQPVVVQEVVSTPVYTEPAPAVAPVVAPEPLAPPAPVYAPSPEPVDVDDDYDSDSDDGDDD